MRHPFATPLLALGIALAACGAPGAAPQAAAPASAPLPAEARGTLTYQRDGNVYTMPVQSKTERKLTDFSPVTPAVFSARSPDGSRLAYSRVEGMGTILYVANADGSDPRKLVDATSANATIERLQWTPDGQEIIYTYHGFQIEGTRILGELFRAERVDPAGGTPTTLIEDAEGPTQAPSGALAFVRTTRTGQQLVLRDPGGGERVLVPERSFLNLAAPRFSRDGQRIAFPAVGPGPQVGQRPAGEPLAGLAAWLPWPFGAAVAYAHGEPWDIWVAEVSGGVRRLSELKEDEPTVAWSEDDRYLAVSGGTGVYIMDAQSGQTTQLAKVGGFGGIDWTP